LTRLYLIIADNYFFHHTTYKISICLHLSVNDSHPQNAFPRVSDDRCKARHLVESKIHARVFIYQ